MEQNLISKKELLDLTGISYGQLYRWKRKNLIPEEWFIKKSSFTGQETYFPKDKIFARISKIKDMKDDLSLNDIANMVSPVTINVSFSKNELVERNIVSNTTVTLYINRHPDAEVFSFDVIMFMYLVDKLIQSGEINIEEGGLILEMLEMNYMRFDGKDCDLFFVRKMGVSTCLLLMNPCEIGFDSSLKIIARLNLTACIEELKIKIS